MKKNLLVLIFSAICLFAYANIRDYVCIVRPQYSEDIKECTEEFAEGLKFSGYGDLAEIFTEKVKENYSFGSGFIYIVNGKAYVITNHHVAAYADTAIIEIQNRDGEIQKKIENCKVIAWDEELDLAIIELPASAGINKGLSLYNGTVKDGIDVWSAGYPGLGDKPSWALAKGTLTNSRARIEELADPKRTYFIQHSAPIDPGSSGGPLLISAPRTPEGYQVLGVNKAQARKRQTTNFAIPADAINSFLKTAFTKPNTTEKKQLLNKTIEEFLAQSNSYKESDSEEENQKAQLRRIRKLQLLIDDKYAMNEGYEALENTLLSSPTFINNILIAEILRSFPFDAVKFAVAYELDNIIQSYKGLKKDPNTDISTDNKITFINEEQKKLNTKWLFSNGKWKLENYAENKKLVEKSEKEKKADRKRKTSGSGKPGLLKLPYNYNLVIEYSAMKKDKEFTSGGNFGFIYDIGTVFGIGTIFNFQKASKFSQESVKNNRFGSIKEARKTELFISGFAEFHFPFKVNNNFYIEPYFQLGPCIPGVTNIEGIALFAHITLGSRFILDTHTSLYPAVCVAYTPRIGSTIFTESGKDKHKFSYHGVSVGINLGF